MSHLADTSVEPPLVAPALPDDPRTPRADLRQVLLIDAHPRDDSYCRALADAYEHGAIRRGHLVRRITLRQLRFEMNHLGQPLEKDLKDAQESILWAHHIAIVYPVWWGMMPALLKGFLDRVLKQGFAFEEPEPGKYRGLLEGRTAQLILTMDTPPWIFRWILHQPSIRALRDATLEFCGIKPVETLKLGPVKHASHDQREQWLELTELAGRSIEKAFRTGNVPKAKAWLQAMRPQFYPFPLLAVIVGALAASSNGYPFRPFTLFLACLAVMVMEFATVLTNEIHDRDTDRANRNAGPFTGGSRVLVENRLSLAELRRARIGALGLFAAAAGALFALQLGIHVGLVLAVALVLGLGYTAPPLRLCYRGLGEAVVAFTHSVVVVMAGYASQGGALTDFTPWHIAIPILFAVFPSIALAGFPDREADHAAGKGTLAVRLGKRRTASLALFSTGVAALLYLFWSPPEWPLFVSAGVVAHGSALIFALAHEMAGPRDGRIDGLLVLALSYMVWFALGPAVGLWL